MFVQGKNTESGWVEWLRLNFRGGSIVLEGGVGHSTKVLANEASHLARRIRGNKGGSRRHGGGDLQDEVWVVCDRDSFTDIPEARNQMRDSGVGLVLSNKCFELWPLLHHRLQSAAVGRRLLQRMLAAEHPIYDHDNGAWVDWDCVAGRSTRAVAHAIELSRRAASAGDIHGNPSTGAWLFHERLRLGSPDLEDTAIRMAEPFRRYPELLPLIDDLAEPLRNRVRLAA